MGGRVRVLVVEDDPDTLAAVATALRDVDEFAVWVAREGQQALAVADELRFNADVLVLDLDLGPGMRGDQFAAEYRRRAPRPTPIIVVSGVPRGYELARSIRAAAVLAKPFDAEELVRTVRLFGGRSREDRAREEADKT